MTRGDAVATWAVRPIPARQAVDIARSALRDFRYPLPRLRTSESQLHAPTVYFCAPDYDVPSGGIRVIYRHVDLLNQAGIPAAVLHRRSDFRCTWFDNRTQVAGSRETAIGPQDLVVMGELSISLRQQLPAGFRFAVFNQNPHLTWQRVSDGEVQRYLASPDLAAILTVSDHSREMVQCAAPCARVLRLHNSIDPTLFFPAPLRPGRVLTYMPRGGEQEARQVFGMLRARGVLNDWVIVALQGFSERQVAERLRSTTIFASFAQYEGFGLPAAEAMACGAYAVGFHGFAGREYFNPSFSRPVEPGDVLALARALVETIERERRDEGWCRARGEQAARFIAAEYSPERERRDVVAAYRSLLTERN